VTTLLADTHGTRSAYNRRRCRCAECITANRTYQAAYNRARRRNADPAAAPHGTLAGYNNYRCRCADCREARRAYDQPRGDR
jgi:hypothetical protein